MSTARTRRLPRPAACPEKRHGWFLPANRVDFWTHVEAFLAKHIGKAD